MRKVPIIVLGLLGAIGGLLWFVSRPGIPPGPSRAKVTVQPSETEIIGTTESLATSSPAQKKSASAVEDSAKVADLVGRIQRALESKNLADHAEVFKSQLPHLVEMDAWTAAKLAESSPKSGEWRSELMRVVAQKWVEIDPADFGEWASQLQDPNERDTVLSCACFKVADKDPRLAIQILIEQGSLNERRETMLGNLAEQWASQDMSSAVDWVRSFPPGKLRDTMFLHMAMAQCRIQPEEAASIVSRQITPGTTQEEAVIAVIRVWAAQDKEGAVAWAELFPPGELRNRVMREISQISSSSNEQPRPR
jgi:hypothetical protein